MAHIHTVRASLIALLLLGMTGALAAPAAADTTATTGASVTVVDTGSLDIHWASKDVQFLTDGEAPSVSAVEGTEASATFSLVVADTRAAENRAGYEIRLSADPFTISGTDQLLPASRLAVSGVSGLPEGLDASGAIGQSLDTSVTLLSVSAGAAAVDTTLDITITMTIPAGTYPGTFHGGLTIEVVPLT